MHESRCNSGPYSIHLCGKGAQKTVEALSISHPTLCQIMSFLVCRISILTLKEATKRMTPKQERRAHSDNGIAPVHEGHFLVFVQQGSILLVDPYLLKQRKCFIVTGDQGKNLPTNTKRCDLFGRSTASSCLVVGNQGVILPTNTNGCDLFGRSSASNCQRKLQLQNLSMQY